MRRINTANNEVKHLTRSQIVSIKLTTYFPKIHLNVIVSCLSVVQVNLSKGLLHRNSACPSLLPIYTPISLWHCSFHEVTHIDCELPSYLIP
jgi:hypothetical protein